MRKTRTVIFIAAVLVLAAAFPVAVVRADEDSSRNILKQGLLGAGVGAISASASGGKAGKGALIGAGTNVIGGALLDTLMPAPKPQPQVQYVQVPQPQYSGQAPTGYAEAPYPAQPAERGYAVAQGRSGAEPKKKIIRKFDSDGKVVSEEEVWE